MTNIQNKHSIDNSVIPKSKGKNNSQSGSQLNHSTDWFTRMVKFSPKFLLLLLIVPVFG